jgi:hypothetical protein
MILRVSAIPREVYQRCEVYGGISGSHLCGSGVEFMPTAGVRQLRKWLSLVTVIVVALLLAGCAVQGQEVPQKPNILVILTDDQEPASVAYMPAVERGLVAGGMSFENDREYYDLSVDPYQLQNTYKDTKDTDPALIADLETRFDALRNCSEEEACRMAENASGP